MTDIKNEINKQNPLGYEKIGKLILKFSVPSITSFLVNAVYNIVDQIYIGHALQSTGIAATNIVFPLMTICTALALLLGVGSASNFNLRLGSGQPEKAANTAGNGIVLMAGCGAFLGIAAFFLTDFLLVLFGVTDEILVYAEPYMRIICIGIPFQVITTGACQLIRSDGKPAYAMMCLISGAVLNIILDPIFIFTLDMGIAGAALATVLSQILTAIVSVFYIIKKFRSVKLKKSNYIIKPDIAKQIFSLGMASCFNQLAMTVVQIVMNNTLKYYGGLSVYGSEIPLACVGAVSKINVVFLAFVIGIAQGCQPINGYNYGAKNYARVKKTYLTALIAATVFSTLIFLVFQIFPRQVLGIFGETGEEFFIFGERYLRIFMMFTFINGIQPITANYFTSIGKARVGIFISLTRQIIFLLPLVIILPIFFGIDGVVYTGPIADFAAFLLAVIFIIKEMKELNRLQALKNKNEINC